MLKPHFSELGQSSAPHLPTIVLVLRDELYILDWVTQWARIGVYRLIVGHHLQQLMLRTYSIALKKTTTL